MTAIYYVGSSFAVPANKTEKLLVLIFLEFS